MSSDACLALLLDGPMQSWGYASRFERRTTALHPTRSGIIGLIAAASGIDKNATDESQQLARFSSLSVITLTIPRRNRRSEELLMQRLEDYHTVTGIRRASGKVDEDATVQTYRHYLLDARFGVLIEGQPALLDTIAAALRNPKWGVWLGRKCCIPASPLLVGVGSDRNSALQMLLKAVGLDEAGTISQFDHVIEGKDAEGLDAEWLNDTPVGFGAAIGERHAPRRIRQVRRKLPPDAGTME